MLNKIEEYIQRHRLFNMNYPILVACSGGRDSMFLVDVLQRLGYTFAIAHCNFRLRGEESDGDAEFVRLAAKRFGCDLFSQDFDTLDYAKEKHISIQEAARELRYHWLEEMRKKNGFSCIVTAHHANDQAETVLIHLAQGSGIKGMQGILPKNRNIVRPMLSITRNEIDQYIKENSVSYREDSSNVQDKYRRNFIRHHIITALEQVNLQAVRNTADTAELCREAYILYEEAIRAIAKKALIKYEDYTKVYYRLLLQHTASRTLFYALLSPYGASPALAEEIRVDLISKVGNGAQYITNTHRIIVERNYLCIIAKDSDNGSPLLTFDKIPKQIHFGTYSIKVTVKPIAKVNMKATERYAYFDAATLKFPLRIRYQQTADYFYPIGMTKVGQPHKIGKKKVSKYFKDEKFSTLQKETTPLLFSGDRLIWIVGNRIDDRHKVTDATKEVVQMLLLNNPNHEG